MMPGTPAVAYDGSSFEEIREAVFADPYDRLPQLEVNAAWFGPKGRGPENQLRAAANRTLSLADDLFEFPRGQKLFQPNGICFTGQWHINAKSPYTGLFAKGSQALIVMRASVTFSKTTRGHKRAFALAGKLFPTLDPKEKVHTANFFAMENFLGTHDEHFLDAELDNNPSTSGLPGSLTEAWIGLRIKKDLTRVDRKTSGGKSDPTSRPLYPISESRLTRGLEAVTPRWMQLRIATDTPRVDELDFRDELRLEHYPSRRLRWDVYVAAGHPEGKSRASWQKIGDIVLDDYIASHSCDARLHFAHPVLR